MRLCEKLLVADTLTIFLAFFVADGQCSNSSLQEHVTALACFNGTTFSGTSGNISSPNYPNEYDDNHVCTWIVRNQPNKMIRVWFVDQKIEADTSCLYDYLTVHVESELLGGRKYCGVDKPRDFVTSALKVTFFFSSDQTIRERGFFISWKLLDACPSDNFTCWDGECIASAQHCDGVRDCEDDSDEIECPHNTTLSSNAKECGRPSVATSFPWDERIVGGSVAPHGAHPWQVMLAYTSTDRHFCGGSIVDQKWVITAAHCTNNLAEPADVRVYVGRHRYNGNEGEAAHLVTKFFIHEKYFKWTLRADIAMFQLAEAIKYTEFVKPICIPNLNSTFFLKPRRTCLTTGWGSIYPERQVFPEQLQQVRVPIVERSLCEKLYTAEGGSSIPLKTLCAADTDYGGVDSCVGDSGGPLVCLVNEAAFYLFGITSFGESCADRKFPGVYTNVSAYYDWISSVMQENESKSPPDQENAQNATHGVATTSSTNPTSITAGRSTSVATSTTEQNLSSISSSQAASVSTLAATSAATTLTTKTSTASARQTSTAQLPVSSSSTYAPATTSTVTVDHLQTRQSTGLWSATSSSVGQTTERGAVGAITTEVPDETSSAASSVHQTTSPTVDAGTFENTWLATQAARFGGSNRSSDFFNYRPRLVFAFVVIALIHQLL